MFTNAELVCTNADPEEYRAVLAERGSPEFVVSSSTLRLFASNPRKWLRGYNPPETRAKRWGSLVDCLLLTPGEFGRRYAVTPIEYETVVLECPKCGSVTDSPTCRKCKTAREEKRIKVPWNARSSECTAWSAAEIEAAREVIDDAMLAQANAAIRQLMTDETIAAWHEESDKQVWVKADWHDKETDLVIPCQCLIDYLPHEDSEFYKSVGDLKAVKNASSAAFRDAAFRYGWHVQGAFDLDMLQAAMLEREFNTWTFIISESYEPWETNRAIFGQDQTDCAGLPGFIELGREFYTKALRDYARCLKFNKWPGYNMLGEHVQGWAILRPTKRMAEQGCGIPEPEQEPETDDAPPEMEEVMP